MDAYVNRFVKIAKSCFFVFASCIPENNFALLNFTMTNCCVCTRNMHLICMAVALFIVSFAKAQDSASTRKHMAFIRTSYQFMHSTHSTNFNGVSADINWMVTRHIALGGGLQYASTPLHNDNGWVLTRLRLFPVYFNNLYQFCTACQVQLYFHSEEGISVNHYHKLDPTISDKPYLVTEGGLYLSADIGTNVVISPHLKAFTEIGYKGYRHSFNALDVNPHGFTARVGIEL